ncbi:PilN domain-containing protein [Aurantimonas sp. NFXS3]|uniref:PilN domain-containing protein n=1 Tax=Aurantimonas sp. NFXS3 TaxID=2818434 RepID=UPI003B8B4D52
MSLASLADGKAKITPSGFLQACASSLLRLVVSKAGHPSFLLVEREGRFECFRRCRNGQLASIGSWAFEEAPSGRTARVLRRHAFDLRLDAANTVTTSVCVPAAGRKHIASIVRHQVERLTPWAPEKAVYGHVILESDPSGDPSELTVRLTVMSRAIFTARMAPLIERGLRPALIGISDDPLDCPSTLDLSLGVETLRVTRGWYVKLTAAVMAVAASIAFAHLAWSNQQRQAHSSMMAEKIDHLRGAVSGIGDVPRTKESVEVLAQKRRSWPLVLLLEDLSVVLPDSTYLTDLSVDDRTLRISGLSSAPSDLISILDGSRLLVDVRFSAPVTRDRDGGRDRFEIEATIIERKME